MFFIQYSSVEPLNGEHVGDNIKSSDLSVVLFSEVSVLLGLVLHDFFNF